MEEAQAIIVSESLCYYRFGMAIARTAALGGTVYWSGGTVPFDGYVLVGLVLPAGYASVAAEGLWPSTSLPLWVKIPITAGVFSPAVRLFYNADLEPPTCRYAGFWYDLQGTQLSAPANSGAFFDVAADPYMISIPTLTQPSASTVVPTPPSVPS